MELSVVPWEMAFQVLRSYSERRQSAIYLHASAGPTFERLAEVQVRLLEFWLLP
jgi:hypothetical protein